MVHRATFYTHFNDKYDLLAYSLKNIAEEFLLGESNLEEAHLKLFNGVIKYKRLFSQLFLKEMDSLRYVIRKEMINVMKQEKLRDGKTPSISTSSEIRIAAIAGATLGALNWWIENGMTLSGEEVYNEIKRVLNWGMLKRCIMK